MIRDLHTALTRSPATLAADVAGGAALFVLFLAVLHLPGIL